MTSSPTLLDAVHLAIVEAQTEAADNVYRPGDWPTQPDQYPIVKMRIIGEERVSIARGGPPEFTTTTTIRLAVEASAPALTDDLGATDVEAALWRIKAQVEAAVVNSYPLTSMIQQIASMRSQLAFTSEAATHLAGVQIDIALEFYEGPESFAPVTTDDVDEVRLSAARFPPAGFSADLSR